MGGGSPTYNYPEQPSYGEGMADALKAQVELLTGTGDFAEIAPDGLEGLLPLEENIRKKTAQTDTDVLRQTLLGTRQESTSGTYDDQGRLVVGYEGGKEATTTTRTIEPEARFRNATTQEKGTSGFFIGGGARGTDYHLSVLEFKDKSGKVVDKKYVTSTLNMNGLNRELDAIPGGPEQMFKQSSSIKGYADDLKDVQLLKKDPTLKYGEVVKNKIETTTTIPPKDAVPVYGKDPNGNIIVDKSKAGQTETIPASFAGDGMINLLGDSRNAIDPATGLPSDRQAGFDADGNFLGLSALAEDIQRGNLSRQREADLADVERLSDRYQGVMEDYRPAATSGLDDARLLLEQQRENLTGLRKATQADVDQGLATEVDEMIQTGTGSGGPVTIPTTDTYGGDVTAATMTAAQVGQGPTLDASTSYTPSASVSGGTFDADTSYSASQVADPLRLQAETSYDPSASVQGRGYTATAGVEGGNIGADTLRAALLADAETALGQGLTEREQAQIANSARARQTLMGRTFDQSGAIQEAQALVAEDNNRRMQNRGFAQSALGQEADIKRDDLGRGLQAQMQNQAALNQAAQFGASQDMQAQLANQAARNQAAQFGVTAGLSQEALAAQQAQAKAMADASAANQASQFGVSAGLQQESQANQAALQAQLANQAATNQARAAGMEAGLSQDAQQAQLDQASNLAQAELTQQANAFGAQSTQQARMANQAQRQQANQFGVGAEMDAERLNETLRQQGLANYINAVGNLARMEDQYMLDPFQALLGRGGGGSLQAGQSVFGQAGYGLNSGPQYLNPEAGLGYISNMAANQANMYAANVAADASRSSGIMSGLGALGGGLLSGAGAAASGGGTLFGGFCWVAREVYGPTNPAWMQFREWMFTESPQWFFELYRKYGERFASWISDKPRLKAIIRKWMDSKIGDK
jgi:hypothetical protein